VRTNFYARYLSPTVREGPRDFGLPKSLGGYYFRLRLKIMFQATRSITYMYFFNVQNKSLLFFKFVTKKRHKKKSKKLIAPFNFFYCLNFAFLPEFLLPFALVLFLFLFLPTSLQIVLPLPFLQILSLLWTRFCFYNAFSCLLF
jgi:hypothetical protein